MEGAHSELMQPLPTLSQALVQAVQMIGQFLVSETLGACKPHLLSHQNTSPVDPVPS